jgi:hypothetical protein
MGYHYYCPNNVRTIIAFDINMHSWLQFMIISCIYRIHYILYSRYLFSNNFNNIYNHDFPICRIRVPSEDHQNHMHYSRSMTSIILSRVFFSWIRRQTLKKYRQLQTPRYCYAMDLYPGFNRGRPVKITRKRRTLSWIQGVSRGICYIFGRRFLRLIYTYIPKNAYIGSWKSEEIMTREIL